MGVTIFRVGRFWHYRFQVDGKRVKRSTHSTSKTMARSIAEDAFQAAQARRRGDEPEPTLGQLVGLWVGAHALILSPDRIQTMETFGAKHIPTLAGLRLRDITTVRVEDARADFLATHARSSANTWLACLRALMGWARDRRMIREIPFKVKKLKVHKVAKPLLPASDAAAWMTALLERTVEAPSIALAVSLMLGLGLRLSEALGARWEWLDFERGVYTPGRTKGFEAWPRPVPVEILDQLRQKAQPTGYILRQAEVSPHKVRGAMAAANNACRLEGITPHRLRATYATWLSEMGVPVQDIQRALGHKDVRTTMGYLEHDLGRVFRAQALLSTRISTHGPNGGPPHPAGPRKIEPRAFLRGMQKKGGAE